MTKRFAGILLVALVAAWVGILLTAGDSTAQLYRYTDKNGRIVFTDNPPPGVIVVPLEDEKVAAPEKDAPGEVRCRTPGRQAFPAASGGQGAGSPRGQGQGSRNEEDCRRGDPEETGGSPEEAAGKTAGQAAPHSRRPTGWRKRPSSPFMPTQENIDRQRKLMEEAQRLREMQ